MAERNFDGIQFEKIRRVVDPDFNTVHDELSAAYYGKKPFRDYGVLDKATFDKLHALVFFERDIEFHDYNLTLDAKEQAPAEKYNGTVTTKDGPLTKTEYAEACVYAAAVDGLTLGVVAAKEAEEKAG